MPVEIVSMILVSVNLSLPDVLRAGATCKLWRTVSISSNVMRHVFYSYLVPDVSPLILKAIDAGIALSSPYPYTPSYFYFRFRIHYCFSLFVPVFAFRSLNFSINRRGRRTGSRLLVYVVSTYGQGISFQRPSA